MEENLSVFHFVNFTLYQNEAVFKITTDSLLAAGLTPIEIKDQNLLDVGTGTGVISLLLKDRFPYLCIDGIDISTASVKLAGYNADRYPNNVCLRFFLASIDQIKDKKYDIIISNPPYFSDQLPSKSLGKAWARHTLRFCWDAFFKSCLDLLQDDGKICLILTHAKVPALIHQAGEFGFYLRRHVLIKDRSQGPIVLGHLVFGRSGGTVEEQGLTLKEEDGSYTPAYLQTLAGWVDWQNRHRQDS